MEFIGLNTTRQFDYPVGQFITENLPIIEEYCNKLQQLIDKSFQDKNIVLCCKGSSGAIIAGIIASKVKISKIVHVKKDGETSHGGTSYYLNSWDIAVIVDDFVCSGNTVNSIYEKLGCRKIDVLMVNNYTFELHRLKFEPDYFIGRVI